MVSATLAAQAEGVAIADLWREYKATGARDLRDRLVLHYAPLVKFVAGRVRSRLYHPVDAADLVSDGIFGLMDAIEKFDPDRGLTFQTYAVARIKGAIMDAQRAQDWVPRAAREKARAIERAQAVLEARHGRRPTEAEVAAEAGIAVSTLRQARAHTQVTLAADDELDVADHAPGPADLLDDEAARSALGQHVRQLRERDQIVIALYYYEGFTLAEIAAVLGVSESRVSQLHSRAMLALRVVIKNATFA
jgi:RNA polymerase sigma factor for flagellar operon FliA